MIEKIKKDQRDHKLYKKQNMIIEVIKKTKVIKCCGNDWRLRKLRDKVDSI